MSKRVAEIQERLKDITQGCFVDGITSLRSIVSRHGKKKTEVVAIFGADFIKMDESEANAEFFVEGPKDIRYLLAEREKMVEMLKYLRCADHAECATCSRIDALMEAE